MQATLGLVFAVAASGGLGDASPDLTEIRQVRGLSADEAAQRRPVRLRGVVTYSHLRPGWNPLFVQDATGGIYVELGTDADPAARVELAAGDLVEVEGVSGPGSFAPVVLEPRLRVVGRGALPKPARRTLDELLEGGSDSLWIEVEGVVRRVENLPGDETRAGLYALTVAAGDRRTFRVIVYAPDLQAPPEGLVDARVRVQGVAGTAFTRKRQIVDVQILSPGFDRIEVQVAAHRDPFDQPVHPVSRLFQFDPDGVKGHRVRVQGTVTSLGPGGAVYVRDAGGGLRIELDTTPAPPQSGDLLDVVGFPELGDYSPVLKNATARLIRKGDPPAPIAIDGDGAMTGDYDSLPVRIEGVLVDHARERGGAWLMLRSGTHSFPVHVERGYPAGLAPGSVIRVQGICLVHAERDNRVHGFRVAVGSARDVTVVRRGRWWTLEHALWTVVALGSLLVAGLVWNLRLRRRSVREQARVKVLSGLLPICAWCKKIRDDQGYWSQVETYIHDHSEADFSHGICPDCIARERGQYLSSTRSH